MFKGKGDIQECKNYRGIKLLSHTSKIWERVVDRRMRQCTNIHESQFGFTPGRSTTDAIFILKQTIEKHREGQKNIRVTLIDLEKAYDSIPREEIWRSSRERNVPEKYIYTIICLKSVCRSTFADCRSQFLLDRLGRCLKLTVSYRGTSSHEFASQFGLAFFIREKHP